MTKRKTIIFYGSQVDQTGMPDPFNRYEIFAVKWQRDGGIASAMTLSGCEPRSTHFPTLRGGPKAAMKLAEDALRELNPGLKVKAS
jgi:hypothetical protein